MTNFSNSLKGYDRVIISHARHSLCHLSYCGSLSHIAGRFFPTHTLSGRQDNRTSGQRYNRTPPHVAGLLSRTYPQNTSPLPLCGSSSRFAGRFLPTRALSRTRDYETTRQPHPETLPHTLRVSPHFAGRSLTLRVFFRALPLPKTHSPLTLRVVSLFEE